MKFRTWLSDILEVDAHQTVQNMARKPGQAPPPKPTGPAVAPTWIKAKVNVAMFGLQPGQDIAVAKLNNGDWRFTSLDPKQVKGTIPAAAISSAITSVRDANGQPIKASSIEALMKPTAAPTQAPAAPTAAAAQQPQQAQARGMLPPDKITDEQKAIDEEFGRIMAGHSKFNHLMIDALAGTGKTTMLTHLAWKYGNQKQKWLYLVFNTKNKVEASEKMPPWVTVATTNGFLGGREVLGSAANKRRIKQTDRMVEIGKLKKDDEDGGKGKLEKGRILADGPEFNQVMTQLKLPQPEAAERFKEQEDDYGYGGGYGYRRKKENILPKVLAQLFTSIRYEFKEEVLKLMDLSKSFSVDPRKPNFEQGIANLFDKYDINSTLEDVKDRIEKYSPAFRTTVLDAIQQLTGYDFMTKDFKAEMVKGAVWMLQQTMPHATNQPYKHGGTNFNLGHFRDFADDLWYAAIHADDIEWPRYDVVLADEVQDFNEGQKIVLGHLAKAGAKIVAVGDENQSIYRFRGADSDAFQNISNQLKSMSGDPNWKPFQLTKNFRSRPELLDFANKNTHVNRLVAGRPWPAPDKPPATRGEVKYDDAFKTLAQEKQAGKIKETAFIARTNEPLVHAGLKLLASGVPFVIIGKDMSKELLRYIDRVVKKSRMREDDDVVSLIEKLEDVRTEEKERHGGSSAKKGYLQELNDTTEAIINAANHFQQISQNANPMQPMRNRPTVVAFKKWLIANLNGLDVNESEKDLAAYKEKMKQKPVVLATAHKSKGLEWDRVYILRDDQFPHARAKRKEDLAQEANARFIAYTRAKDEFHILDLKGQPGVKDQSGVEA